MTRLSCSKVNSVSSLAVARNDSFLHVIYYFFHRPELPDEPINVVATRDGGREATVKWEPPESLDKRDLVGYVVEARESSDIKSTPPNRWTRVGPSTVRDATRLRLTDLNPSMDIQFRVLTRTHAGLSEPSEPTEWLAKPEPKSNILLKELMCFIVHNDTWNPSFLR